MIKHLFLIWGLLAALTAEPVLACTSAVVSGKVTPDGRPLLWKNRDTDYLRNHVAYIKGEKYNFIADVNSDNFPDLKEAWVGTNSAGFALMNTQSYNLVEVKDGEERGAANGRIIYRALEVCATVEDFRHFLDTISKPSLIEANFGVIDAQGGAAVFEVDYYKYTMYDANNPKDAPYGYIARTNFSFAGEANRGAGYVRYSGSMVCSKQLYKEALGHDYDEPKQWELREINDIMNNAVTGWRAFSNPRYFPEPYRRQKGWERIRNDNEPDNSMDGFQEIPTEEMEQLGLPEEWLKQK